MTEQGLREKLAYAILCEVSLPIGQPEKITDQVLALFKEAGYVRLAEDQNLPSHIVTPEQWNIPSDVEVHMDGDEGQGWRKVILTE